MTLIEGVMPETLECLNHINRVSVQLTQIRVLVVENSNRIRG